MHGNSAVAVRKTELLKRINITLFGGFFKICQCLGRITLYSITVLVNKAQILCAATFAFFTALQPILNCLCLINRVSVIPLEVSNSRLEICVLCAQLSCLNNICHALGFITFYANAIHIQSTKFIGCVRMLLFCSFLKPESSFLKVFFYTVASKIVDTSIELCTPMPQFCRLFPQLSRPRNILFYAKAIIVSSGKLVHTIGVILFGGFTVILSSSNIILFNTITSSVSMSHFHHGVSITQIGCNLIMVDGFLIVLLNPSSIFIGNSQIVMACSTVEIGTNRVGFNSFYQILGGSPTLLVTAANTAIYIGKTWIECNNFAKQFKSFVIVLLDSLAHIVCFGNLKNCLHIICFRFC